MGSIAKILSHNVIQACQFALRLIFSVSGQEVF